MVHGKNRIPYWIDRRLTGLAGPDYDATISFGLPFEPEDSQYGKYRLTPLPGTLLTRISRGALDKIAYLASNAGGLEQARKASGVDRELTPVKLGFWGNRLGKSS